MRLAVAPGRNHLRAGDHAVERSYASSLGPIRLVGPIASIGEGTAVRSPPQLTVRDA